MKLRVCAVNSGDMSCGVRRCERGLYAQGCANLYSARRVSINIDNDDYGFRDCLLEILGN
jgi:hypothetical protein